MFSAAAAIVDGGASVCMFKLDAAQLPYQALLGCLIYAAKTRPDVAYAISDAARFIIIFFFKAKNLLRTIKQKTAPSRKRIDVGAGK